MNPEGVARLFSIDKMNDGPFPEHYEPIESPIGTNPLHPAVVSSPVARIFHDDIANMGKADASRMSRPPIPLPNCSATGPNTRASTPSLSPISSSKLVKRWRRKRASRQAIR
jgi:hypothetical protein